MADKANENKVKASERDRRYVRRETPPKQDRTRRDEEETPRVIFTDWAAI